jgi:hypothetical protein
MHRFILCRSKLIQLWLILVSLLSLNFAHALEDQEELYPTKILEIPAINMVILNRGLEDGIFVGNHGKLLNSLGYAARAQCLKVQQFTSLWKIYRIADASRISKDTLYTLQAIPLIEKPQDQVDELESSHERKFKNFDEEYLRQEILSPAPIKSDMSEDLKSHQGFKTQPKTKKTFLAHHFDKKRFESELSNFRGLLAISPWSQQRGPIDADSLNLNLHLGNYGKKYDIQTSLVRNELRYSDSQSKDEVRAYDTRARISSTINQLSENVDGQSFLEFRASRYGDIAAAKRHFLFSPLGFRYRFLTSRYWIKRELSYGLIYDKRTQEFFRSKSQIDAKTRDGLRHGVSLDLERHFESGLKFLAKANYRPFQEISTWKIDRRDYLAEAQAEVKFPLMKNVDLSYRYEWLDDAQLKRISNLPRVITTQSFFVNFNLDL